VGKITEKAVCRSAFLTTWHCTSSAELTKTHSFKLFNMLYNISTTFYEEFRRCVELISGEPNINHRTKQCWTKGSNFFEGDDNFVWWTIYATKKIWNL